ncbi:class II fructose-bisphosphate aldolase [Arthrobacter halodurans]|uniref:Class II fructose-bisphosphate aldolase n=1 Tax=Arthrobacter halodurans TaxID=516699 RepID=A0ABV4USD7_9MICC
MDLLDITRDALARGAAVPAVACYDFTTALGVVAAAESAGSPVVLLVPPKTAGTTAGLRLVTALRGLADAASVPVVVQLDHARDEALILAAVDAGVHAVLADGSHLSPDDNASFVARMVLQLGPRGVVVEAELGALPGDEDNALGAGTGPPAAGSVPAGMTEPALVAEFMESSGADLLAVSIGNAHGNYTGVPHLDWEALDAIRGRAAGVPLVLHGASGIPAADLSRAGERGIGKVNFNTELRTATLDWLTRTLSVLRANGENMLELEAGWRATAEGTAAAFLATLSGAPRTR